MGKVSDPRGKPRPNIICLEGNGYRPSHFGDGWKVSETMYTLNSTEVHAVCYELLGNYKCDGAVGGGISFSIVGDHDNRPTDMTNVIVITKDEGDNIAGESSRRFKNKD